MGRKGSNLYKQQQCHLTSKPSRIQRTSTMHIKSVLCHMHFAEQRLKAVPIHSRVKLCLELWKIWAGWAPDVLSSLQTIPPALCRALVLGIYQGWHHATFGFQPTAGPFIRPTLMLGSHSSITALLCLFLLWVEVGILLKGAKSISVCSFSHGRMYRGRHFLKILNSNIIMVIRVGSSIFSYTISLQVTVNRWDHSSTIPHLNVFYMHKNLSLLILIKSGMTSIF